MFVRPGPGVALGTAAHELLRDLIVALHASERHARSILVFLPTYRALEMQNALLEATGPSPPRRHTKTNTKTRRLCASAHTR